MLHPVALFMQNRTNAYEYQVSMEKDTQKNPTTNHGLGNIVLLLLIPLSILSLTYRLLKPHCRRFLFKIANAAVRNPPSSISPSLQSVRNEYLHMFTYSLLLLQWWISTIFVCPSGDCNASQCNSKERCEESRNSSSKSRRRNDIDFYYASILNTLDLYVFMDIIISYRTFEIRRPEEYIPALEHQLRMSRSSIHPTKRQ